MTAFDPYYEWLSIPPEEQPANFYRLLGLKMYEANSKVIASAADRQMAHVRRFCEGDQADIARNILVELSNARAMLSQPVRKSAYDTILRSAENEKKESEKSVQQAMEKPAAPDNTIAGKGDELASYAVLQPISIGPNGHVYKAQRISDGTIVSLKIVPPALARSDEFLKRLKREFDITQSMHHPHIAASYELGQADGVPYLAFEYVGGTDLERLIAEHGPLSIPTAIEITRKVAEGLAYLHKMGVVHRNMKPQSILVNVQGDVKIANLTKAVEDDARAQAAGHDNNLTVMGQTIGSLHYLPPEQAVDSHKVDGRADLYALGCTLHHLLIGRPPYHGLDVIETLKAHRAGPIPSLRRQRSDVPAWLDRLYQELLAKKPSDRPATADEVAARLVDVPERSFHIPLLIAGGIAILAVTALLVFIARS